MNLPLPEVEEISEQPINQWHAQLLAQADNPPISHRNWESQSKPVSPCRLYDWPENETR